MSNNTRIKYTVVDGKLFKISNISFYRMEAMLIPCNEAIESVPENEVFPLEELRESFKIRIEN